MSFEHLTDDAGGIDMGRDLVKAIDLGEPTSVVRTAHIITRPFAVTRSGTQDAVRSLSRGVMCGSMACVETTLAGIAGDGLNGRVWGRKLLLGILLSEDRPGARLARAESEGSTQG